MHSYRRRSTALVLILAGSILLASCGPPAARRIGLRSVAADLVFGIPPLEEPAAPPDTLGPIGPALDPGPTDTRRPIQPGPARRTCPDPEINEVRVEADTKPSSKPPLEGTYVWRQEGHITYPAPLGRFSLPPFTARLVQDADLIGEGPDYEFTTVQLDVVSETEVEQTFQVITSRPDPRTGPNIVRDEGVTNGIFLTRIVRTNFEGRRVTFNPNPPILFIPLPVVTGFQRTTHSSDPINLQLLSHSIDVRGRQRQNACGELVDSWFVEGFQTFSSADETFTRKYNYAIATQFGGLIVFEHVERPCNGYTPEAKECGAAGDGDLKYDTHIAQVEPD